MVSRVLYSAAIAVLIGSVIFVVMRGEVRCGMDDFRCWEGRGWMPVLGGATVAAILVYVGRAIRGGRDG